MSDTFGQSIQGLHKEGDAVVSTDQHIALLVKDASDNYVMLNVDANGALTITATDLDIRALDASTDNIAISDGTNTLAIDGSGNLTVNVNGTVTVDATDLDIRDLSASQDNVAISDGTNTLAVNGDGSINVVTGEAAGDSVYTYGSANLVKDTATEVVSVAPSADESYSGIHVSGAGYCEWAIKFGTTGSENTLVSFWTTPSNPTHWFDMPDYLEVSSGESLIVEATNRETKPSPRSDFTGHASLIRKV